MKIKHCLCDHRSEETLNVFTCFLLPIMILIAIHLLRCVRTFILFLLRHTLKTKISHETESLFSKRVSEPLPENDYKNDNVTDETNN